MPDAEIPNLRQQIADLQRRLSKHRRLVADTQRELEVAKRQVQAYAEGRQRVADEATEKGPGGQLEGRHHRLENGIAAAGPMRA